ncbi:MAG: hypothetical protein LBE24_08510 [Methylobacillus sp.]|jgi:hypothetical protein|nr:hypothetical protein [Methylobacillus sp.]
MPARFFLLFTALLFCSAARAEPIPQEVDSEFLDIPLSVATSKPPLGILLTPESLAGDPPKLYVCNADKTERATLVYYDEEPANNIIEINVEPVSARYTSCIQPRSSIKHFISGKGIQLGLRREQVEKILGKPQKTHLQLDEVVLVYRLDSKTAAHFLQRHDAHAYFGQYHFRQGKLVRFNYGFELH